MANDGSLGDPRLTRLAEGQVDSTTLGSQEAQGVTTAPAVSAGQELEDLRAEVRRLRAQLASRSSGPPARDAGNQGWPPSGLTIDYGQNVSPHVSTHTIMNDRFKAGTIRPSSDFPYLPKPTTDRAQLEHDFVRWGYCLVGPAMTQAQMDKIVARMVDQAAAERAAGVSKVSHRGNAQLIFNCVPKGQEFRDLIEFHPNMTTEGPLIEELLDKILGKGWYLGTAHGSIVHQGGGMQGMHQDQGVVPIDLHPRVPLACLIIWLWSDFNLENGGTYIVPGSHRDADGNNLVRGGVDYTMCAGEGQEPGLVALCAPAGCALLTDSRLLHSGAQRTAPGTRYGMRNLYLRGFMRQQENHFVSVPDEVVDKCSPKLRAMMGYQAFGNFGMVNGITNISFSDQYWWGTRRPKVPVGELSMSRPEEFNQDFDEKYSKYAEAMSKQQYWLTETAAKVYAHENPATFNEFRGRLQAKL